MTDLSDPDRPWDGRPLSTVPVRVARQLRSRMTRQEARLWVKLRAFRGAGHHIRRQVPIDRYVVDFACIRAKLVIELDGGQHSRDLEAQADRVRDERLGEMGWRVLRFWNSEVDGSIEAVVETIVAALSERLDPTPVRASRDSPSP